MKYRTLGSTNTKVSIICLGTMTWGEQNTEEEGFAQMDFAFNEGVNFFDTAELYSVPPRKETWGLTERIIGKWLKQKKCREKIILATKVVGRSGMKWFRNEETRLNKKQIHEEYMKQLKEREDTHKALLKEKEEMAKKAAEDAKKLKEENEAKEKDGLISKLEIQQIKQCNKLKNLNKNWLLKINQYHDYEKIIK